MIIEGATTRSLPANQPLLLDDPAVVWIVETGTVDVFFVAAADGEPTGPRNHVMRAHSGQAVFGFPADGGLGAVLTAVGSPDTRLLRVDREYLQELDPNGEPAPTATALLDGWIDALSQAIAPGLPPQINIRLEPGFKVRLSAGKHAICIRDVVWTQHYKGSSHFAGLSDLPRIDGGVFFPLVSHTWLTAAQDSGLTAFATRDVQRADPAWNSFDFFQRLALQALKLREKSAEEHDRFRLKNKAASDFRQMASALYRLASPLSQKPHRILISDERDADPLVAACQEVGDHLGVEIKAPVRNLRKVESADPLRDIARASNIRYRRVLLRGRWWKEEHGPLLGYWQDRKRPVALLPTRKGYEVWDPNGSTATPVTEAVSNDLDPSAHAFYVPFPDKKLTAEDLFKFGIKNCEPELGAVLLGGIAGGLLGLIIPFFTGMLFDTIIPGAQRAQLLQITALLIIGALATSLFDLTRSLALLRIEGKMGASLQAALWDRLMSLPVSFFRDYNAGDLSDRANGIDGIRSALTGTVTNSIVAGIFSIFNLALMFYYSWKLSTVAIGLVAIAVAVTLFVGQLQMQQYRELSKVAGGLSGQVLQFISGIAKFRVSGTENRAFAAWARMYSQLKASAIGTRTLTNRFQSFNSFFFIFGPMALFYTVYQWTGRMTAGDFLAFNSAFGQMFGATMGLTGAAIQVMSLVPVFERATPILQAVPEVNASKVDPGELSGTIEVSHVSFRYRADGPLALKDISFRVEAGEMVAMVGPSGCGKSTIFRLLLGFEDPETGAVYYDDQDLQGLDLNSVRRQMGVVLQNSTLFRGDIFSNIIGSKPLTLDDAWEAARLSGLDDDIRDMPMGMHTIISDGGGGLSGGQRQRLMIARAIVSKPRILLFDEATSALDNRTQATVSRSLEGLKSTRVVIAHRLSTVVNANRILVFDHGELVESGTYQELLEQDGTFAQLAKRQLT